MKKILFLVICFITASRHTSAQALGDIPFEFTSEEDNRFIKENDSLKYYVASDDTNQVVCINEEASFYMLYSKDHKLIAEGAFTTEGDKYLQEGKWIERFPNGKTKVTGSYRKNKPIGTWQEYYPTGKIKTLYNYAVFSDEAGGIHSCLSGSYEEYYPDGKLKISGFYSSGLVKVTDTQTIVDPVDGHEVLKETSHNSYKPQKIGRWEYYAENGDLDKKEDF